MDYVNILNKTDAYIKSVIDSNDFQELLALKKQIDDELKDLIIKFNTAKDRYYGAQKYGKYHPSISDYKKNLLELKKELYSNSLVKKYFSLQNKVQKEINDFLNDLKASISNKFKKNESININ